MNDRPMISRGAFFSYARGYHEPFVRRSPPQPALRPVPVWFDREDQEESLHDPPQKTAPSVSHTTRQFVKLTLWKLRQIEI